MTRFDPRRLSSPVLAALLCVAVALLSYLALVAYDDINSTAFWR